MPEQDTETQPSPESQPDTPIKEESPPARQENLVSKDRYDALLAERDAYKDTLATLQRSFERPQQTSPGVSDDPISDIAKALGAENSAEVRQWATFLSPFFNRLAQPYVGALANAADKIDALEAQLESGSDYKTLKADIEKIRSERQSMGQYISRKEAYHLARSKNIDSLIASERQRVIDEMGTRKQDAHAATIKEDSSIAPAGPARTRTVPSPRNITPQQFAAMSFEEKEKFLTENNFTF